MHRHLNAAPDVFLKAVAPYRDGLGVALEGLFTWSWLAALCAQAGSPLVRGHARYMNAVHGGNAQHDQRAAQKRTVWRRGGRRPQADVYPAAMRGTRDLRRRWMYRTRQRAARLAQIQQTTRQDNLPERGNKLADNANRDGGAERCPDPAVQKCRAVDLALLGSDDPLRSDLELHLVNATQRHDAHTLSLLQTVPGMGKILRLVRRSASHELQRFPSVQDCLADGRLVTWAQDSAGQRKGTAGAKRGHASLQWAVSPAAGLCRRDRPAGHTYVTKRANQHGQGNA